MTFLLEINILDIFSKFEVTFSVSALFHNQVLLFVHVFCWNNEYILDNISPEDLGKSYIDFCNNTFTTDTAIVKFGNYIWEIALSIKILKFNDRLEIG